jgi:hypothetical protein
MMRDSYTQRRHEPRDRLAVATAYSVPAYSCECTYRAQLILVPRFVCSIAFSSTARRVIPSEYLVVPTQALIIKHNNNEDSGCVWRCLCVLRSDSSIRKSNREKTAVNTPVEAPSF